MQCNHNQLLCNCNQRLFARLKEFDYLPEIMVLYVRQKITIELIYPLNLIHKMICQFIGSMNMKRKCVETLLKNITCCHYYESYKQAFQINSCCFNMVKPMKLVTQAAIMASFWHCCFNYSFKRPWLASSRMTSSQSTWRMTNVVIRWISKVKVWSWEVAQL